VQRWSRGEQISAEDLRAAMDIPSTRAYVAAVRARYDYYRDRGDNIGENP